MSAESESTRVRVVPGTGVVARAGDAVLYVDPSDPAHRAVVEALLDALAPGVVAGDAVGSLERVLAGRSAVPPVAVAEPSGGEVRLLLSEGTAAHWDEVGEHHEINGSGAGARQTARISGPLTIGPTGVEHGEAPAFLDLRDGAVPGGGLVLDLPGATPGASRDGTAVEDDSTALQPAAPPPVPEPEPPAPFQLVDLNDPVASETRPPLPVAEKPGAIESATAEPTASGAAAPEGQAMVDGIRCVRGHFNHPEARFCAICGINFQQQTVNVVKGPRPPLGVIVVDDGTAFSLDTDYVLGREPELDAEVAANRARPLIVVDDQRSVSRVHAEVRLQGWNVMLSDRGSANGTFVFSPDATAWSQLPAGEAVTLAPGTRVAVGQRTFVYESHHVA